MFHLRKSFWKTNKNNLRTRAKTNKRIEILESKSKSIEGIFTEGYESAEIKNKVDEIKEYEKNVNKSNMIYHSSKESFDFNVFKTIRSFGENIYSGKTTTSEADQGQSDLAAHASNFNNKGRPRNNSDKKIKKMF